MARFERPLSKPTLDVAGFAVSGATVSLLVEALDLARVRRPLDGVLTRV
jgi:hypothetical protein